MSAVSLQRLFNDNRAVLDLVWLAGHQGYDRTMPVGCLTDPEVGLIAHLNLTHPHRIQVLGALEVEYLTELDGLSLRRALETLFCDNLAAIVIAEGHPLPEPMARLAEQRSIPVLGSPVSSASLINQLRHYLDQALAEQVLMHGVFMVIHEVGVLITGESAIGKSELALELITRGHGLVADDAVEIYRISPDTLQGRCPPLLTDFLEVRGLGLINIRSIFGETAVRPRKNLKLNVHLERPPGGDLATLDRLPREKRFETILGLQIPRVDLPVAIGRNLAVLVEAATRNFILEQRGIDSTLQFIERQKRYLAEAAPDPVEMPK